MYRHGWVCGGAVVALRWCRRRWSHACVGILSARSFYGHRVAANSAFAAHALRQDGGGDVQCGFKGGRGLVITLLGSGVGGLQYRSASLERCQLSLFLVDVHLRFCSLNLHTECMVPHVVQRLLPRGTWYQAPRRRILEYSLKSCRHSPKRATLQTRKYKLNRPSRAQMRYEWALRMFQHACSRSNRGRKRGPEGETPVAPSTPRQWFLCARHSCSLL